MDGTRATLQRAIAGGALAGRPEIYDLLTRHALHILNLRKSQAREVKLAGAFLGEKNTQKQYCAPTYHDIS